jgi:S1-C subfamily serine protease
MSAPVTENELFTALRGYASTLEVQYMIEEELKKFQEKTLPKLLDDAVGGGWSGSGRGATTAPASPPASPAHHSSHAVAPSSSLSSGAAFGHASTPDAEWVQTFLKAHIDDTVARRLPTMIAQEVRRQLQSAIGAGAVDNASNTRSEENSSGTIDNNNQSNSGSSSTGAADLRSAVGLPPLPPPLAASFSAAAASSRPAHVEWPEDNTKTVEAASVAQPSPPSPLPPASPTAEARRQRAQILSAIEDIELQVNSLQRAVDRVAEEGEQRQRRWAFLCATADKQLRRTSKADATTAAESPDPSQRPLHERLEKILDSRQEALLLDTLEALLTALLPTRPPPAVERHVQSLSRASHEPSASSPNLVARRLSDADLSSSPSQPQQQLQSSPEVSPMRADGLAGRSSLYNSEPPSPPPTAPFSTTRAQDRNPLPAPSTVTHPAPPPPPPLQPPQHVGAVKGVRSITTKGSAATSPSSGPASVKSLPTFPGDGLPIASLATAVGVGEGGSGSNPQALPPFPSHFHAHHSSGLEGTAVRRPAPSPRECVDPVMQDGNGCAPDHQHQEYQHLLRHRSPRRLASSVSSLPSANSARGCAAAATKYAGASTMSCDAEGLSNNSNNSTTLPPSVSQLKSSAAASASTSARHITLGIDAVNVPAGVLPDALGRQGAVRVQSVAPRQLAAKAGVCRGDILLSVDGRHVRSCEHLRDVLLAVPPTQNTLAVELYRHTAHQILTVQMRW